MPKEPLATAATPAAVATPQSVPTEPEIKFRSGERKPGFRSDDEALDAGALPGQRALIFKDRKAMEKFLAKLGDKVKLLGRIDALNALQVGFLDPADLAALLAGDEELAMIFPAYVPEPKPGEIQDGVVGVGGNLLRLLGITGDNSQWGKGVLVAILDTGVSPHSALGGKITTLNLVPMATDLAAWNGHGTAVASLVIGKAGLTPGVAPGANALSIRIANDEGVSNSRLIAEGIVAAVDGGANPIIISMGSTGDSALVRKAIAYATEAGVVIVAAAGNYGSDQISFPAANEGVTAIGTVDARGTRLAFSNTGDSLAAVAPGLEVNAAWTGDQAVAFTGTSASAPIMGGGIVAAMSPGNGIRRSATEARDLVLSKLDDGGQPGADPMLGGGTLNMARVMNAGTPGIYDAAVTSNYFVDGFNPELQVVIQNRGTEMLLNAGVTVTTPNGTVPLNITTLAPDHIQTFTIALPPSISKTEDGILFDSSVKLSGSQIDSNPLNNRRVERYIPPEQ